MQGGTQGAPGLGDLHPSINLRLLGKKMGNLTLEIHVILFPNILATVIFTSRLNRLWKKRRIYPISSKISLSLELG